MLSIFRRSALIKYMRTDILNISRCYENLIERGQSDLMIVVMVYMLRSHLLQLCMSQVS